MSVLNDAPADWTPPPYFGHVIDMVERLRAVGIEPSAVSIPAMAPEGETYWTCYGLPVHWDCGGDRVQVLVDVAVLVPVGGSCGAEEPA